MFKMTQVVIEAFLRRDSKSMDNTATDGERVTLFGNKIIERTEDGDYLVTMAGWETDTTRERINGFFELHPTFNRVGLRLRKTAGNLFLEGDYIVPDTDDVDNKGRLSVSKRDILRIYTAAGGVVKVERTK